MAKEKQHIPEWKTALITGIVAAALYVIWVVSIGLGGQTALNLFLGIDLLRVPSSQLSLAIPFAGLAVNFVLGLFAGWLFAKLWNVMAVKA